MARETRTQKKKAVVHALPLTRRNYQLIGLGVLNILLGYIALAQEPWDGTVPLVVAPILLFLGYCVLVPLGILYRRKEEQPAESVPPTVAEQERTGGGSGAGESIRS